MTELVRLQRYLAAAGVAARRKAEELITAGRVKVNGAVVTVLGTKVDPEHDAVTVDGEAVAVLDRFYVLFNKPKGCITAVTDDRGRPTVMDYLPNLPVPVAPVGRLDFYSEGVLLLTNDGDLAARLLAPASHVPKTYHVKVHGRLERTDLAALRDGITLEDGTTTLPAEVEVLPGESKHIWLGITIYEGKNRQIHRMIEALGHQVDKLQRVAFANLTFHDLRVGDARELTQQELNELRDLVGLDHSTVARGRWRSKREETDIPRRARAKARAEHEAAVSEAGGPGFEPSDAREDVPVAARRDGPDARRRNERGQSATYGEAASPRGERGRSAGYGEAASRRSDPGRSGRGSGGAARRGERGRSTGYGERASGRGERGRSAEYGGAASRRSDPGRSGRGGGGATPRDERGRSAGYGERASGRGERGRSAGYGERASGRGERGRSAGYGEAASQRGARRSGGAYGEGASQRDARGQGGAGYGDRADRKTAGGNRGAPARRGFGPRVPSRGRKP
ncbi:MAG TPA: pseudouridine synthase [Kofleriaceae bacterium]